MGFRFEKTGAERKALVKAVSEVTGYPSSYLGAPNFAYQVGGYTISADGTLDTGDTDSPDVYALLTALEEYGFVPAEGPSPEAAAMSCALSIELPAEEVTDTAFDNLQKLVSGKAALIRMAVGDNLAEGAEGLPIVHEGGIIGFPWFRVGMDAEAVDAWTCFFGALWAAAKKQSRVTLKERPLVEGDSIKFLMRCFCLKIGMIGDGYKAARRIILEGLPGNGSRKVPKAALLD
jgi:hypothetical protein